jgi:hypothetical protein
VKYSRVGLVAACGLCLPFLLAMTALVNGQPQVERVIEVAPRCPGTRSQTWASLAWSPQSQCWLVAWREGYLNEEVSDIWCARISAGGKALDPAGIRITSGPGLKDKPQVASDGTDFMVVWEDLRNGRDWDVYAARVTAQGKVLDANGFVVAAGQHNQCRPDVGFAAGFYLVVWQEFVGDGTPNTPGNAYVVRGKRISSNGKPADDQPIEIARIEKESHALNPVLACQESTALVGFTVRAFASGNDYFARRPIDVASGRVLGPTPEPSRNSAKPPIHLPASEGEAPRRGVLAINKADAVTVLHDKVHGAQVWKMAADGKDPQLVARLAAPNKQSRTDTSYPVCRALASDGDTFLLLAEWPQLRQDGRVRMQVRGWRLGPDAKPQDDADTGFILAADERRDQLSPAVAAGPQGIFLAVWSERRGPDDIKVVAQRVLLDAK